MSVTPRAAKQLGSAYLGNIECRDCFHLREAWSVRALADLGGGGVPGARHPLWDSILSFLHTFSPKSACIGGPCPPNECTPPYGKS